MEKFKILSKNIINQLPKTAGVYCFIEKREIIYIGKAINIKNRVKNHFQQPSYRDNLFIKKIKKIGFIKTDSEIEALILEANLIKKYQPKFNVIWRDDKNYFYVAVLKNTQKIPYVYITHQPEPQTQYIGPFVEGNALKKTLKFLRKVFPYYTSSRHPKQKCTWCHLELCPGPNHNLGKSFSQVNKEYKKNIKKLILILRGKRKVVFNSLKKEMKKLSKEKKFEDALRIRDKIFALQNVILHTNVINDKNETYIIKSQKVDGRPLFENNSGWLKTQEILQGLLNFKKPISKIECYDVSNIQGKQATGSMVAFVNGKPDKNQYKKFRIKMENKPNDIAMLKEVLERRLLHPEWQYPEIILIDGGIAQLNVAIKVKKQKKETRAIKIISVAKRFKELYIEERKAPISLKTLPREIFNLIINLDDEAHRFALNYHKKLRKKYLLN